MVALDNADSTGRRVLSSAYRYKNQHELAGATMVLSSFGINGFFPMCLELDKRARLIVAHTTAVAYHVGSDNGCETTLHRCPHCQED